MAIESKKGVSPVIATVLLISIALILAVIIFLWVRSFVSEKIQKFDEPIENSCEQINFEAEAFADNINIVNRGNVPLYGLEIRKVSAGTIEGAMQFPEFTIGEGESSSITLSDGGIDLGGGEELLVVPIILGEAKGFKKAYTCDEKYGLQITYSET